MRSTTLLVVLCLVLASLHAAPAIAANPKDVSQVIRLMNRANTPRFSILYYLVQYSVRVEDTDGKPKLEVWARTLYGDLTDRKGYICIDQDLDGLVDYGQYKEGAAKPLAFYSPRIDEDPDTEIGKARRTCQDLYDMAIRRARKTRPVPEAQREEPK